MVEPLASVILTTLLLRRTSSPRHPNLKSFLSVMGRPVRSTFSNDFFTPHARLSKGKGREVPDAECSRCAESPSTCNVSSCCVTKHSIWCPRRNCLLMVDEMIPRRPRLHRRSVTHHSTRRHASSLPARAQQPSRIESQPASSESVSSSSKAGSPFQQFTMLLQTPEDDFALEEAWSIYDTLLNSPEHTMLEPEQVLCFAEKLVAAAEPDPHEVLDLDVLHIWGSRIAALLQSIETQSRRHSSPDLVRMCLLVKAQIWLGDLPMAISTAQELQSFPLDDRDKSRVLRVYQQLILSTQRQHGVSHVLDFLIKEWDVVGSYLHGRYSRYQHEDIILQTRVFRETVFGILSNITNPTDVLSDRRTWAKHHKQRACELLIEVYCAEHLSDDAVAVMEEMERQGLSIPYQLKLSVVRALARDDAFLRANTLFSSLSSDPNGSTFKFHLSTGLYLFAHQGHTGRANHFFNELQDFKWASLADIGMLMHAYAVSGGVEKVVKLFHEHFPDDATRAQQPNIIHYTAVIFAHAQRADFDGLNFWLEAMSKAGFPPDVYVYNIVLKSFAIRREVDAVAAVLDQMRTAGIMPTRVLYTTVITLLAKKKDPVAAEAIYKRAIREGIEPDRRMITSLMNAHVEAGSWPGVVRVFDFLKSSPSRRVKLSIEVYNTLLKAYVLIGAPFRVVSSTFRKLEASGVAPDNHTFALLIQSACDAGLMRIALEIYERMERTARDWQYYFHINQFVLTIIMAGYLRLGDKVRAKAVYEDMQDRGIQPSSITYSHILQAYGNEKTEESMRIAEAFLQSIMEEEPSERGWRSSGTRQSTLEHVYRPLMLAYARQQQPEEVERLFEGMIQAGGEPSLGTLTMLLDAYRRSGDIESVHDIWPQIWQLALRFSNLGSLFQGDTTSSSNQPIVRQGNLLCIPLSIYIDALSAAGEHLTIAEVWGSARSQGFSFDSHNWNHLAVALVRAGEPERAFEIIERVILPYQRQSEHILGNRETNPESPLIFDVAPPDADDLSSESPMHKQNRRAQAVQKATKRLGPLLDTEGASADFAHPLHILHQISPSWNVWRPHSATLDVLSMVLTHLDSGIVVQPVQPKDETSNASDDTLNQGPAHAQLARDILHRIYHNYPLAVQIALDHERVERRREVHGGRILGGWS